jgi:hypothetical protein
VLRAQAKRSSAANRDGSAPRGSVFGRRDDATRASSPSADGSSAPSRRGRLTLLVLAIAAFVLLALAPLSQAKVVVNGFGTSGSLGGQFSGAGALDINQTGNGAPAGTFYVADGNNRLQRLSPSGAFERLWGRDVIRSGAPGDLGSTFFEICTIAANCQSSGGDGAGGIPGLGFNGGPRGIAVNQTTGNVYASSGNSRIFEFDADGNFIRLWGWDVVRTGGVGNVSTNAFEICTVAADCITGDSGDSGGQLSSASGNNLLIDSSGNVWVPDAGNRRIQEFDSSGNFIAAYGHNVDALGGGGGLERCTSTAVGACRAGTSGAGAGQFSANNPASIAFDSGGSLYAIDAGNRRVQRFDPTLLASATDFATATFANGTPERVLATMGGTRLVFSLNNTVTANPAERQIVEIDPADASVKDTSLVGSGLTNAIEGLAFNNTTSTLYATTQTIQPFGLSPFFVLQFGAPLPDPSVVFDPVVKTDTTATFSTRIDPRGGLVRCTFQYSTDQVNWTDVAAPACNTLVVSSGSQTVIAPTVTGLVPNTKYFVRLQTFRPLVPGSTATTGVTVFFTDSVPPVITDVGAVNIADTSARMVGTINPKNSATGYVFQYGTTPALGFSTAPLAIGGGNTPITISQVVGSLSPDTTYYFKLAATNDFGTTVSVSRTLHTRTDPLPSAGGRRYEQVSPVDKNYGDADSGLGAFKAGVSLNGDAVAFCPSNQFGDPPGRMTVYCSPYISRRSPDGWQTPNNLPPFCHVDSVSGTNIGVLALYPSADFSRVVIKKSEAASCPIPPLDPAAPLLPEGFSFNLYLQDPSTDPPSYDLLNPQLGGRTSGGNPAFSNPTLGGSDDFSHVVYMSGDNQTAPPDSPDPPGTYTKLYEWDNGVLRLVTKDASNEPFRTNSYIPVIGYIRGAPVTLASPVSDDGERIYFANPVSGLGLNSCIAAGCQLYMRENGAVTYDVSASECTVDCGSPQTYADFFLSATPSGAKAFFTSCAKLTDDSNADVGCSSSTGSAASWSVFDSSGAQGSKLYRWDRNSPPGSRLVDLTVDHEPADGVQPNFFGLIGQSEDGDTAYFVTRNQIVSGEPTFASTTSAVVGGAITRGAKLYRWRWNAGNPSVDYLGPYQTLSGNWSNDINLMQQHRLVAPDGRYLMLYTRLAYDPAGDRDADADIYRWDEEGGFICVSCQLPGAPSGGDVDLSEMWLENFTEAAFFTDLGSIEPRIEMSEDGQRIFFGTPDTLVSADTNGEGGCPLNIGLSTSGSSVYSCEDVYEWHDGTVGLVSSGTGTDLSRLIGSDVSGENVFFFTRDRLVGWDLDGSVDIYDARIGGGFPEPPAQPPICEGESCRGAGTTAPSIPGAGSARFEGPPNPRTTPPCPRGKRRVVRNGRTRCVAKKRKRQNKAAKHNRRAAR